MTRATNIFSDGISEELLNLLSKIPQLRVAARTSSFSLKGKEIQVSEVGEVLKVDHVPGGFSAQSRRTRPHHGAAGQSR